MVKGGGHGKKRSQGVLSRSKKPCTGRLCSKTCCLSDRAGAAVVSNGERRRTLAEPTVTTTTSERAKPRRISLADVPWWVVIVVLVGIYLAYAMLSNEKYIDRAIASQQFSPTGGAELALQ